ncbi:MAG TPA: YqgE/AlgH family protein [Burkholderiales bacterium]|nr:YqgE/AlgH family protein [Burkholderiales bacterium]
MKNALVACLLSFVACAAHALDLDRPMVLVAAPDLRGPYSHTTLLVVPLDGQHFGFILNRATDVTLGTLFPDHAPSGNVIDPVYLGGPEHANEVFAVVPRNPGEPSLRLFGDVFLTAHAPMVDQIIEQTPNEARYFVGFVAWQPGELAAELEAGYWYLSDPDPALVFSKDTERMWESQMKRLGKRLVPRKGLREA